MQGKCLFYPIEVGIEHRSGVSRLIGERLERAQQRLAAAGAKWPRRTVRNCGIPIPAGRSPPLRLSACSAEAEGADNA